MAKTTEHPKMRKTVAAIGAMACCLWCLGHGQDGYAMAFFVFAFIAY